MHTGKRVRYRFVDTGQVRYSSAFMLDWAVHGLATLEQYQERN